MPLICTALLLATPSPTFAEPIRLTANDAVIDVTTGHAAPYVYDFNGDGIRDLLVGEFGDGDFRGDVHISGSASHGWANGRLRIYLNSGTNTNPRFTEWTYLQGGGQTAAVPITCCVSFVPQFVDYDNDGIDDVLSASYPGDMYWWKGAGDGMYGGATRLMNTNNEALLPWAHLPEKYWKNDGKKTQDIHSTTAELHDIDADGDLDLWIGSRLNGTFTIENTGTRSAPVWSADCAPLLDSTNKQIGGWFDGGSNVHLADWDGDGVSDIVFGGEDGAIRWCHNSGQQHKPILDPPVILIPEMDDDYRFEKHAQPARSESRAKVHVVDWDGDGLNDLLVGDFGSTYERIQTLTAAQEQAKSALNKKAKQLSAKAMPLWNAENPLTPAQEIELENIDAALNDLHKNLSQFEEFEHTSHGWVWLYRQTNPSPK
jgi:hypothetical protein